MKTGYESKGRTGIWIWAILLIVAGGCVERKLTIVTDPSDAVVWLNDEEIGISPVSVGFNWYGDYKVRIEKSGYEILNTHQNLPAPAEDHFPLDFFTEVLWPGTLVREYNWSFTLQPTKLPAAGQMVEEAEEFSVRAKSELEHSRTEISRIQSEKD